MDTFQAMCHTYKVGGYDTRELRRLERKFARKASKVRTNYPVWTERTADIIRERLQLKLEQRYLHLARGFIKGLDYKQVENSTREFNEVSPTVLTDELYYWGIDCTETEIESWINGEI